MVLAAVALAACGRDGDVTLPIVVCPAIGWYAVAAEIRDQDGQPAARGATVTVKGTEGVKQQFGFGDPLLVHAGEIMSGRLEVTVTKPFYSSQTISNVSVVGDPQCGIPDAPAKLQFEIHLLPNAPAVRQVVVPSYNYGFGDGNISAAVPAYLEADPAVSRRILWSVADTSVARVDENGVVTSQCRTTTGHTRVIAASGADPSVRSSVGVTVSPASTTSGRCS